MNGLFIGNGTLLVQCAEQFRLAGGTIAGILSQEQRVREWATKENILLFDGLEDTKLKNLEYDYLFSIVNFDIFPQHLPTQPKKYAVNFFDGPLPIYTGVNVTSWAIMQGETEHSITWHEMKEKPDEGRILKSQKVSIDDDETSMSLNAKCYEAGLASFMELVQQIKDGKVEPQEQGEVRHWYDRKRRPENLGTLDFKQPAKSLGQIVRGLDFGAYANPLGLAKIWTGKSVYLVGKLEILEGIASGPAGLVIAKDKTGIRIAASDSDVLLSVLRNISAEDVSPEDFEIDAGETLPTIVPLDRKLSESTAQAEDYWQRQILAARPPQTVYPELRGEADGIITVKLPISVNVTADQVAAGLLAWFSLLTGSEEVSCALRPDTTVHPLLSEDLLINLVVNHQATVQETRDLVSLTKFEGEQAGPRSVDLIARVHDPLVQKSATSALSTVVSSIDGSDDELIGKNRLVYVTGNQPRVIAQNGIYSPEILKQMATDFAFFLEKFLASPDTRLRELPLVDSAVEQQGLAQSGIAYPETKRIHDVIKAQTDSTPERIALEADGETLTYAELERRTNALASALAERGAGRSTVVGLCLERSADLVIAMLAILKTGAAYLPLDPSYPAERVAFMLEDSEAPLIVASHETEFKFHLDPTKIVYPDALAGEFSPPVGESSDLAYLMYTSGSTGIPKGVMLTHRNIINFFAGTDLAVPHAGEVRLLAITSVSFDISVLEIFWTLARGFTIILQTDGASKTEVPGFSLFYFASEVSGSGPEAYRLLLQGAKFADENGFEAIWTPERHFHAFGGLYPNPAVSSAAVASITKNVHIRAGSCVLPLHHPIRVAEDWALVDNISDGRAGIAIASGWQPNDFVLAPDNFEDRKDIMLEGIDTLRSLWRGESISFPNHKGEMIETSTLPSPVGGEIPLWLTAAGNPETFAAAAKSRCYVLTHLLGQKFEDVAEKIRAYRVAWREAGHPGQGKVTLMLHTFVGEDEDEVREIVREPMKEYLRSSVDLLRRASWSSPTFQQKAETTGLTPQEVFEKQELTDEETEALLDHAFERYYQTSGLFGTTESCQELVRKIAQMGVDEIGCLIDFGVDTDLVLKHLTYINELKNDMLAEGGVARQASVAEQIVEHDITHFQCTPSMASFLVAEAAGRTALSKLEVMMVGGEGFPVELARNLRENLNGTLLNMYGTTETAVWSSIANLEVIGDTIPLGDAMANTVYSVRNQNNQILPSGVAGELWIGGDGVADGYWKRPELTAERFLQTEEGRVYRTGDLVRHLADGRLEFHGRMDNQVKVRGHRIELGEIEAALDSLDEVKDSVVTVFESGEGDKRLVAFVTIASGQKGDGVSIRKKVAPKLPEFMIPSQVIILERLPQTPNGKVDRKALPEPRAQISASAETVNNETENLIAKIWCEALGLADVNVTDNFFDLGGHSLLVVQVQRRLKEQFGKEIAITDMFRYSTIRALAEHVVGGDKQEGHVTAAKRGAQRAAARRARMMQRTGTNAQT
jgi:natural product biosynthesis luciferase-like monooxygenase protein